LQFFVAVTPWTEVILFSFKFGDPSHLNVENSRHLTVSRNEYANSKCLCSALKMKLLSCKQIDIAFLSAVSKDHREAEPTVLERMIIMFLLLSEYLQSHRTTSI
jgi:hypothetical protein